MELGALDHFLFLAILAVSYPIGEWKKTLWLILAFTIGHSVSMFITLQYFIPLAEKWIELFIALTILFSALINFPWSQKRTPGLPFVFASVLFFGLIHGLGFSMQVRSLLGGGQNAALPLLYFNLGLETVQNIIVIAILVFSVLLATVIKLPGTVFKLIIICFSGLTALFIAVERLSQL